MEKCCKLLNCINISNLKLKKIHTILLFLYKLNIFNNIFIFYYCLLISLSLPLSLLSFKTKVFNKKHFHTRYLYKNYMSQ